MKVWKVTGDISNSFEKAHDDWVSCVKYSPFPEREIIVSGGWDKLVKVWHSNTYQLLSQFKGHNGYINTITVSPDASLCASGGKDGQVILWDLTAPKVLYPLDAQCEIHAVCFSPIKYWLCAATDKGIKIWDLPSRKLLETLEVEEDESFEGHAQKVNPIPLSLAWSADGMTLFAGYTDNYIRIWHLINPRFEQ
ncbi:cross-pathway control WD-repeat protein cpc2 [Coelomomyces lativittatus]|nr:cross-pathway control WD-repeat protein cpc2 [Coelomomyces lativittatus]